MDQVNLMNILESIINNSKFHMMYLLINDVVSELNCDLGKGMKTKIGICQGDFLSALLFILYITFAMKPIL